MNRGVIWTLGLASSLILLLVGLLTHDPTPDEPPTQGVRPPKPRAVAGQSQSAPTQPEARASKPRPTSRQRQRRGSSRREKISKRTKPRASEPALPSEEAPEPIDSKGLDRRFRALAAALKSAKSEVSREDLLRLERAYLQLSSAEADASTEEARRKIARGLRGLERELEVLRRRRP